MKLKLTNRQNFSNSPNLIPSTISLHTGYSVSISDCSDVFVHCPVGVEYSQWSFRLGGQEYSTTSYNKLQLKLFSLVHVDIVKECNTLFQKVSQ